MTLRERVTASVTDIRTRGQRLVQLNMELLSAEMKQKGKKVATGAGLFAAAGLFSLYAIGFALATIAVALALVLPLWLSLLIVTLVLFLLVTILALVGRSQMRQLNTAAPGEAIEQAKASADLMKTNWQQTAGAVRTRMTPRRKAGEAAGTDADAGVPAEAADAAVATPLAGTPPPPAATPPVPDAPADRANDNHTDTGADRP